MLRIIRRSGVVQVLLLAGILALCLSKIPEAYTIYFAEAQISIGDSPEQVVLEVTGANLYRPNSFYIDGEMIGDAIIERINYQECRVILNRSVFDETGKWYRLELGFTKWGVIRLLSSPIWIEWTEL